MSGCDCGIEVESREQSRVLIVLLLINGAMFLVEIVIGIMSQSTALIADAMDMLADATVYGIGLYAVGRPANIKIRAAGISGVFQIILGLGVAVDVVRRWVWGSEPESLFMMGIGMLALVANVTCLVLIAKYRKGEVHMRASWIFSRNDVIANLGIIAGGLIVYVFGTRYPDLVIGLAIAVLVIRGGVNIMKEAAREKREAISVPENRV